MTDKIKIDIISDVVCPWCIIGYKRLEKAIAEMGIEDKVQLDWQPFELNPQMPSEGQDLIEHIAEKYGSTLEQQKASQKQMTDIGAELDFKFDFFEEMRMPNTFDAHILLEYAKENGKQTELNLRLVTAFFSEQKDISDSGILLEEIINIGLDLDEATARLNSDDARYQVQTAENYWKNAGVTSVPTVVFNCKSAVTGAQPVEIFKKVLTDLIKEK